MLLTTPNSSGCSLYLVTPFLSAADADAFAGVFAEVLDAVEVACGLVRLAPTSKTEAKAIMAPLLRTAIAADCALLVENDPVLAARLGVDGVHVAGASTDLAAAIEAMKPERIVGAGNLHSRDAAMTAGEMGADYVMFGEPHGGAATMGPRLLVERVGWWAEIFETPCVAYADTITAVGALAHAGADFVALGEAIWRRPSPAEAAREAQALLVGVGAKIQ
jgi:thiamine-phosphate pyrophosphorylase